MERHDDEPRLFTVEDANLLIPHVRELVEFMQARKRELDGLDREIAQVEDTARGNGHEGAGKLNELRRRALIAAGMIEAKMANLRGIGCELKGIEQGLVDFPTEREGRIVYLCWQLGEDVIAFWHELHAGFAGRQPL